MDREEKKTENEELTIEEAFAQLEELTQKMENSQTSLEDSFALYQRGMELLRFCSGKLTGWRRKCFRLTRMG